MIVTEFDTLGAIESKSAAPTNLRATPARRPGLVDLERLRRRMPAVKVDEKESEGR